MLPLVSVGFHQPLVILRPFVVASPDTCPDSVIA